MQVLYLQISYKDNIIFSLNRETVEKSFGLLHFFLFKSILELNKFYLSLIHNYDRIFIYSKLNMYTIKHSICWSWNIYLQST